MRRAQQADTGKAPGFHHAFDMRKKPVLDMVDKPIRFHHYQAMPGITTSLMFTVYSLLHCCQRG
jgi:hypothetical protein